MRGGKIVSFLLCLLLLAGCAGNAPTLQEDTKYNIGVVLKTMDSEHWNGIQSGMQLAARNLNVSLTILYPSNEWAEQEQKTMIADLLQTDLDALIVAPCNSTDTGWFYDAALDSGIVVYTVDTRAMDRDIPYVGIDNEQAGKMAADYLQERLGGHAKLAVIAGASKQAQTIDRVSAFQKRALGYNGQRELLISKENSGYADAISVAQDYLEQGVQGVFCASAVMGLGAAVARSESEGDFVIVTIDTQDDALRAVQNGTIDALITQSGYEIGRTSIEVVVRRLDGYRVENVYLETQLLTAQNIDAFLQEGGSLQ